MLLQIKQKKYDLANKVAQMVTNYDCWFTKKNRF